MRVWTRNILSFISSTLLVIAVLIWGIGYYVSHKDPFILAIGTLGLGVCIGVGLMLITLSRTKEKREILTLIKEIAQTKEGVVPSLIKVLHEKLSEEAQKIPKIPEATIFSDLDYWGYIQIMEFLVAASTKDGYTLVEQDVEYAIDMVCQQLQSEGVNVERKSDKTSGQVHISGLDISEFAGYLPTLISDIPPVWMKENKLVRTKLVRNLEEKRVNILHGLVDNGVEISQEEGVVDYLKKLTTAKQTRCTDMATKTLAKIQL